MNGKRMLAFAVAVAAAVVCGATVVRAGDEYVQVAELTAGGDAKEVAVNKEISKCMIHVVDGSVTINTLVVREGGRKTPIPVTARIEKGSKHEIDLGGRKNVTGFRISDGGRGTYRVLVKK
jgi:hypothetical protein